MRVVALVRRLQAGPDGTRAASLLGPCDEAAFRAALALRAQPGVSLTVVAAGPPDREDEVLEHALAAGADRAVRVYDPSLDGVDYHGVARVLSAVARQVGFDLILLGAQSADEGNGAVGPAVAEALGVAHVTSALDVTLDGKAALVKRRDQAHVRTLRVPLPLLVTVTRSPADLPAGLARGAGAVESMGLDELGIQAMELRHRAACLGEATPVAAAAGAELFSKAGDLISRLRDERLIP
jgi:electron transfer flavoprotein beta subunit